MWIKTKAGRLLAIALLLAWWLACWLATGAWFDDEAQKAYRTESARAERFVADAVPGYNRILRTHSGVPRVLARDPDIRRTLARFGPEPPPPPANEEERRRRWSADPDLAQTSSFLEVSARELGFDALVLLNANGDCVAASNAGSARSIVGASYGDRDDFQSARAGRSGYLASVGKRMGSTGVSFYAPVIDHGRFIGVVTGGNALAPFVNLIDQANAFLSDRNGVVLLARDSSLLLHALPGAPVSRLDTAARQALYHRTELTTLDFAPWGNKRFSELLRVPGRVAPAIPRSGSVADGGLTVSVLWPMPQLLVLTQQRLVYAGALGTIGTLLLLLAAVYVTRRREQRVMALALAEREQTATDSRNFLDQIVNAIADPIFVKDREHRWVLVNQSFCEFLGQPREYFIGKSDLDVLPEREARIFWDTDERVLTAGIENINEEKLTDSQGRTHIVLTKKAPYTDTAGQRFIVGIISDISERKQVERLLRAREQEFRTLAENSPDPIYRYDRDCRRLYVNPVVGRILGKPVESLIGSSPADGSILISEQNKTLMEVIRRVFDHGESLHHDIDFVARSGQHSHYDMLLVPERDTNGQVVTVLAIARDISERRQHEAALRKQQELLAQAQRRAHVGSWEFDHVNNAHSWSDEFFRIFEIDPQKQAATYEACLNAIHPDDREAVDRAYADALAARTPYEHEHRLLFQDGRVKHVHERCDTVYAPDGSPLRSEGMLQDITERKLTERSLEEARNRLLGVLQTIPDLVWLKNGQGIYLTCNPTFERFFGAAEAEIVGKTDYDFVDAKLADFFREKDRLAMDAGRICINEEEVAFADDGRRVLLETRKVPMRDADGNVIGVLGIGRDISERKRLEAEIAQRENGFRTLVENSPDSIIRYDRECRRIYCNPAQAQASGMPNAELLGKTTEEYSPFPADVARAYATLVRQVFDNAQAGEMELNWERNGVPACLHMRVNPEFDGEGRVVSALAVGRDVSVFKQAETHLRKSRDVLRALAAHQETEHEKTRQELAFQIHEDLAQNLTALRMNISLFEMSGDAASRAPLLKTMSAIAERSIVRIRDIVSMLRPTVLDLGLVPALQWLTDDFEGVGFQFELALQEDILLNDEVAIFLFRATQEALINIALHAAATHVHLFLDSVTGVCRLVVRDNGCGFDRAAPRREGSFGLIRLSEQARHLGGDLVIDSTCGQGTSFEVQVPAFRTTTPHLLPDFSGATPT